MIKECVVCTKLIPKVFPSNYNRKKYCSEPCARSARRVDDYEKFFWEHVDKTPGFGPNGDCWEWTGSRHKEYGRIKIKGKYIVSTRFAFNLHHPDEPLKEWEMACHHCDWPPCQRPDHIFRGTGRTNAEDAASKGRMKTNNRWLKRHEHVGEKYW